MPVSRVAGYGRVTDSDSESESVMRPVTRSQHAARARPLSNGDSDFKLPVPRRPAAAGPGAPGPDSEQFKFTGTVASGWRLPA